MQIKFERSGGLMGRKVNFSIDLDDLPDDQASSFKQLLNQADFFNLPENLVSKPVPDEFTYIITVEAGTSRHMVRLSDSSMTDSMRPLVQNLSGLARGRGGKPKA